MFKKYYNAFRTLIAETYEANYNGSIIFLQLKGTIKLKTFENQLLVKFPKNFPEEYPIVQFVEN